MNEPYKEQKEYVQKLANEYGCQYMLLRTWGKGIISYVNFDEYQKKKNKRHYEIVLCAFPKSETLV